MKHFILLAITFLFCSFEVSSQSFSTQLSNGEKLFFSITDSSAKRVEIVSLKSLNGVQSSLPSGTLQIPSTVKYNGSTYFVMSIGEGAFAGADELTSVLIPSSIINIGAKAFSGCSKLESIVFPSCKPQIGNNAFEGCRSLSSISFGSDWTSVDLQLFADAKSLNRVLIPAKAVKVTGVKQLPALQRIDVDPNNKAFSSNDGMLYSRDGKIFYACPNAKSGEVSIKFGTETVLSDAFAGCVRVSRLLLPESIHEFDYDEFADCSRLSSITIKSEMPPITAKWNGSTVFAIKAPNQYCAVYVPKEYLSRYRESVCNAEGTYETLAKAQKTEYGSNDIIGKKSIKRIKKLG